MNLVSAILKPRPSRIHFEFINSFSLPEAFKSFTEKYFILYWSGAYTIEQIKEGIIERDGDRYVVVYGPATSRGKILSNEKSQVALSFRKPKKEYDFPAYVILSLN